MWHPKWLIVGLIALNVGLGVALCLRGRGAEPTAYAQAGRGRAEYLTVTGHQLNKSVLYMFEANSGRLAAVGIDADGQRYAPIAQRDVIADFNRAFGAR